MLAPLGPGSAKSCEVNVFAVVGLIGVEVEEKVTGRIACTLAVSVARPRSELSLRVVDVVVVVGVGRVGVELEVMRRLACTLAVSAARSGLVPVKSK